MQMLGEDTVKIQGQSSGFLQNFCFTSRACSILMVIMSQRIDLPLHTDIWVPGNWLALQAHISLYKHFPCKGLSTTRKKVEEQEGAMTEQCPFCSGNLGRLPGGQYAWKRWVEMSRRNFAVIDFFFCSVSSTGSLKEVY